ncbi:MAG: thioredoxin family protein [Bacteroidota bacterium]
MNQRRNQEIKIFAVIGIVCAIAAAIIEYYPTTTSMQWVPYESAFQRAKTENKLVYLDVYAEWCGPCKMMDKTTYTNHVVTSSLQNNFIATRVNIDDERAGAEVKKKFNIVAMPTSLLLTSEQLEVRRKVGYMDVEKFIDWIVDTTVSEFMVWDDFATALANAKRVNKSLFVLVLHDSLKVFELQRSFQTPVVKQIIKDRFIPTILFDINPNHRKIIQQYSLLPFLDFIGCIYTFSPSMELRQTLPLRNDDAQRIEGMVQQLTSESGKRN